MKRLTITLVTILWLLLFGPVTDRVAAKDNWIGIQSRNFFLVGNASESKGQWRVEIG